MNIVLRIVWKLIKSGLEAIGVMMAFCYVLSGFGALLVLPCIAGMFGSSTLTIIISSSIVFTLIICSWIVFIVRWFKRRIKEEKNSL